MRNIIFVLFMSFCAATPGFADDTVRFVFDVQPGAFLISSDAEGYKVSRGTSSSRYYNYSETIQGSLSWIPSLRLGLGIATDAVDLDLTGGCGILWNAAISAPFARADIAARFKPGSSITIGPHAGMLFFQAPEWSGDAPVTFSSTNGVLAGVDLTIGKKFAFKASVDYMKAVFDAKAGSGWVLSSKELDMSGLAIQLGFLARF